MAARYVSEGCGSVSMTWDADYRRLALREWGQAGRGRGARGSKAAVCKHYGVSSRTMRCWRALEEQTGSAAPLRTRARVPLRRLR